MRLLKTLAGRVVALTLFAGAIAVVVVGLVLPYTGRLEELERDSRLAAASIERISARVQHRDRFAQRLSELERQVSDSDAHVRAPTTALGTAEMQRLLVEAATRHGVQVQSTQALPSAEEMGFERITLRADLGGFFPDVIKLLNELESGRPYIFLEAVEMKGDGVGPTDTEHPRLSVRTDLVAYMMGPQT